MSELPYVTSEWVSGDPMHPVSIQVPKVCPFCWHTMRVGEVHQPSRESAVRCERERNHFGK